MGNTTVVEINHDLAHSMLEDPVAFVNELMLQVGQFKYSMSGDGQIVPGVRVVSGFHRGDTVESALWYSYKDLLKSTGR